MVKLLTLLTPDLIVFVVGLLMFGGGLALAWPPLGLIGPGAVLMGITLFGNRTK